MPCLQADATPSEPSAPDGDQTLVPSDGETANVSHDESSLDGVATPSQSWEAPSLAQARQLSGTLSTASSGVPLLLGHAIEASDASVGSTYSLQGDGSEAGFRPGTPQLPSSAEGRAGRLPAARGNPGPTLLSRNACEGGAAPDSAKQAGTGAAFGGEDLRPVDCKSESFEDCSKKASAAAEGYDDDNRGGVASGNVWGFAAMAPDAEQRDELARMEIGVIEGLSSSKGVDGSTAVGDHFGDARDEMRDGAAAIHHTQKTGEKRAGVLVLNVTASSCMHETMAPISPAGIVHVASPVKRTSL